MIWRLNLMQTTPPSILKSANALLGQGDEDTLATIFIAYL